MHKGVHEQATRGRNPKTAQQVSKDPLSVGQRESQRGGSFQRSLSPHKQTEQPALRCRRRRLYESSSHKGRAF